jgi:hypothetical protein
MELSERCSLSGESIDVVGFGIGMPVAREITETQIVAENEYKVRFLLCSCELTRKKDQKKDERSHPNAFSLVRTVTAPPSHLCSRKSGDMNVCSRKVATFLAIRR